MSIQLTEEDGGKVLVIHVSGKLVEEDYEALIPAFERLVAEHGKLSVLFDTTDFHGWEAGAAWEDLKFGVRHFADIERLAVLGERQWQRGMTTFVKPFTGAAVRYFEHADAAEARSWLHAG